MKTPPKAPMTSSMVLGVFLEQLVTRLITHLTHEQFEDFRSDDVFFF